MNSRTAERLHAAFAIAFTFAAWGMVERIDAREASLPTSHIQRETEWDAAFAAANAERPVLPPRELLAAN